MYPSGQWAGFYVQSGRRTAMSLSLTFEAGIIAGGGVDRVGEFYIRGSYTPAGDVAFTKTYVGRHSVRYQGNRDGHAIRGAWSILRVFRDRFRIWPLGQEVEETSAGVSALTSPPLHPVGSAVTLESAGR